MHAKLLARLMVAMLAFVAVVSTVLLFRLRSDMENLPNRQTALQPAVTAPAAETRQDNVTADSSQALKVIHERTSVRRYRDEPVNPDLVEKLLKAGMAAPTAGNRQPWYFVATTDKTTLLKLARTNENGAMLADAGAAIVVVASPEEGLRGPSGEMWVQDCSAATQNILLAAHALGLGAVWIGTYPVSERVQAVRDAVGIPEPYIPLSVISIGWPDNPPPPKNKFKPEKIFKDTWGNRYPFENNPPTQNMKSVDSTEPEKPVD